MTEKQGQATSGDARVALLHLVDLQHLFRVGTPDRRPSHLGHTLLVSLGGARWCAYSNSAGCLYSGKVNGVQRSRSEKLKDL